MINKNRIKVKIKVEDDKIIERIPKVSQCGNFVMLTATYNKEQYLINEGDEYLNGYPKVFTLGKKISKEG